MVRNKSFSYALTLVLVVSVFPTKIVLWCCYTSNSNHPQWNIIISPKIEPGFFLLFTLVFTYQNYNTMIDHMLICSTIFAYQLVTAYVDLHISGPKATLVYGALTNFYEHNIKWINYFFYLKPIQVLINAIKSHKIIEQYMISKA